MNQTFFEDEDEEKTYLQSSCHREWKDLTTWYEESCHTFYFCWSSWLLRHQRTLVGSTTPIYARIEMSVIRYTSIIRLLFQFCWSWFVFRLRIWYQTLQELPLVWGMIAQFVHWTSLRSEIFSSLHFWWWSNYHCRLNNRSTTHFLFSIMIYFGYNWST